MMRLSSFKLRFADAHVRIVPATDAEGCAFAGPGVDLRGDDAKLVLAAAEEIVKWFQDREPGARLRSFSMDLGTGRALATIEDSPRPRVIESRGDPELRGAADSLVPLLCVLATAALARRVHSTS
jgi:hypothetical protein